jgi:hypothetical protein
MSTLMKGSVVLADGSEHAFVIGPRERIKAERELGIKPADMKDGLVGESYLSFLIFEALKREGKLEGVDFDTFIDKYFTDYEVDADPESAKPLSE